MNHINRFDTLIPPCTNEDPWVCVFLEGCQIFAWASVKKLQIVFSGATYGNCAWNEMTYPC